MGADPRDERHPVVEGVRLLAIKALGWDGLPDQDRQKLVDLINALPRDPMLADWAIEDSWVIEVMYPVLAGGNPAGLSISVDSTGILASVSEIFASPFGCWKRLICRPIDSLRTSGWSILSGDTGSPCLSEARAEARRNAHPPPLICLRVRAWRAGVDAVATPFALGAVLGWGRGNGATLTRTMGVLPPRVRGRHRLRRDHQRAQPPPRPAQRRLGVEVYAGPPPCAARVVRVLARSHLRLAPGGGAEAPLPRSEVGTRARLISARRRPRAQCPAEHRRTPLRGRGLDSQVQELRLPNHGNEQPLNKGVVRRDADHVLRDRILNLLVARVLAEMLNLGA